MGLSDREAMDRAIDLSWRGWGRVHPNPMVGAVVVRDGRLVGEGWHAEYGERHAEVMALDAAGSEAKGATLVVTLEPCRHQGKQPPCVDAVLEAGIRQVVIGARDPHPDAGGGGDVLRRAGIDVHFTDDPTVLGQNAMFHHTALVGDRPYVAVKLATSVDGRVADREGNSRWISGTTARGYVHWLRAGFEGIAVGGRTARLDDPLLTVRGPVVPRVPPRRIVFTRSGDVTGADRLLSTSDEVPVTILLTGDAANPVDPDKPGVGVLRASSLLDGLRVLRQSGTSTLLVEGGGELVSALFDAGLVDRFYWVQSPLWLGPKARPAFGQMSSPLLDEAERWTVVERRALGVDTLIVMDRQCSPVS